MIVQENVQLFKAIKTTKHTSLTIQSEITTQLLL